MWLFNRRDGVSPPRSPSASPVLGSPHLRTIPSSSSISNQSWQMASKPPASHKARVLLLVVAGVHVFLTAGVVFGWASLADALALAGAFCDDDECSGRASAFAIIFTLGTIGNYTSNLPFGLLLDRYGPNVCCTCGASVQILGTLLMLAPPTVGEWVYYPGFFLLGFGGPGIQISTFHLANLYPTASGSLIAASTALFDAGTAVFFGFSLATASGALTLTSCWLLYLGGCGFVLLTGLLLWPHVPFEAARDESDDESPAAHADALLGDETPSFRDQLASRAFVYLVCFAAAHILRLNFIVGTFQLEVASLGFDAAAVSEYTTGFASALPFGFIGMPLIGFFLDRRPLSDVFLLVNLTGLACIALLLVPHSPLALSAAIGLVAVGRSAAHTGAPPFAPTRPPPDHSSRAAPHTTQAVCLLHILRTAPADRRSQLWQARRYGELVRGRRGRAATRTRRALHPRAHVAQLCARQPPLRGAHDSAAHPAIALLARRAGRPPQRNAPERPAHHGAAAARRTPRDAQGGAPQQRLTLDGAQAVGHMAVTCGARRALLLFWQLRLACAPRKA